MLDPMWLRTTGKNKNDEEFQRHLDDMGKQWSYKSHSIETHQDPDT